MGQAYAQETRDASYVVYVFRQPRENAVKQDVTVSAFKNYFETFSPVDLRCVVLIP